MLLCCAVDIKDEQEVPIVATISSSQAVDPATFAALSKAEQQLKGPDDHRTAVAEAPKVPVVPAHTHAEAEKKEAPKAEVPKHEAHKPSEPEPAKEAGAGPGETFAVKVTKSAAETFGLEFCILDNKMAIVVNLRPGGLIEAWNKATTVEGNKVLVKDRLVKVNGKACSTRTECVNGMKNTGEYELVFMHPKETTAKIEKDGKSLGLQLRAADQSVGVLVDSIAPENATVASAANISVCDRIIEVNGISDAPEKMVTLLQKFDTLDLKLLSYK
jgi:hypothetical protein